MGPAAVRVCPVVGFSCARLKSLKKVDSTLSTTGVSYSYIQERSREKPGCALAQRLLSKGRTPHIPVGCSFKSDPVTSHVEEAVGTMDAGSLIRGAWELVPILLLLLVGGVIAIWSGVHHLASRRTFARSPVTCRRSCCGSWAMAPRCWWSTSGSGCGPDWAGDLSWHGHPARDRPTAWKAVPRRRAGVTAFNLRPPVRRGPRGSCAAGAGAAPAGGIRGSRRPARSDRPARTRR